MNVAEISDAIDEVGLFFPRHKSLTVLLLMPTTPSRPFSAHSRRGPSASTLRIPRPDPTFPRPTRPSSPTSIATTPVQPQCSSWASSASGSTRRCLTSWRRRAGSAIGPQLSPTFLGDQAAKEQRNPRSEHRWARGRLSRWRLTCSEVEAGIEAWGGPRASTDSRAAKAEVFPAIRSECFVLSSIHALHEPSNTMNVVFFFVGDTLLYISRSI